MKSPFGRPGANGIVRAIRAAGSRRDHVDKSPPRWVLSSMSCWTGLENQWCEPGSGVVGRDTGAYSHPEHGKWA
jgi:hypothetical protein